jgi:hypothetical protein
MAGSPQRPLLPPSSEPTPTQWCPSADREPAMRSAARPLRAHRGQLIELGLVALLGVAAAVVGVGGRLRSSRRGQHVDGRLSEPVLLAPELIETSPAGASR